MGDLTPVDGVPKVEKNRREAETMDYICDNLLGNVHGGVSGKDMRRIWQEYEDSETLESQYVHDIDKVELILQMVEYERAHNCTLDLSEFSWVAKRLCLPEMKEWAQEILDERQALWEGKGKEAREPRDASTIKDRQNEYYGKENGEMR